MIRPSGVVDFQDFDAYIIAKNMRQDEIVQYLALTGAEEYDPIIAARGFVNMPGVKFTIVDRNREPVAIGGFSEVTAGVWQSWMAGTDAGWESSWRTITKASLWLREKLFESGARRVQTNALASRTRAIEWYERSLELVYEGTWEQFGHGDEDVVCYAMTRRRFYGIGI